VNERHLEICASAEWALTVEREILPWAVGTRSLGDDVLEVGPGPGLTTDILRRAITHLTAVEVEVYQVKNQSGQDPLNYPIKLNNKIAALRAHQARQQAERAAAGAGWAETGYVFTTPAGKPVAPDRLTRLFRRLVAESGLPPVTLHGLRHGAATLALAAGTDLKIVADQLGVPFEDIRVLHGDTQSSPKGMDTYGSRSLTVGASGWRLNPPFRRMVSGVCSTTSMRG